jgi:peptide/nickel transport system permease protein
MAHATPVGARAEPTALLGQWRQENAAGLEEARRALYRFVQNRLSLVGLGLILALLVVAITGPLWAPYPADATGAIHAADRFLSPRPGHLFGTDELGRDVFSRVVLATRLALASGLIILAVAISIGVTVGSIAGYFGRWLGESLMRLTDMMLAIPGIFLALAITAAMGPGIIHAIMALSVTWWPGYARLVQGQVQAAREQDYVEAERSIGARPGRIIFLHIVPNIISSVIVKASMDFGFAILSLASLGFIGVGAQPPTPEWGEMISYGRQVLPQFWWYSTFPGLAMFIAVFGFSMLGDGLRDVFDPKSRI